MKGKINLRKQPLPFRESAKTSLTLSLVWNETHSVDVARSAQDRLLWHFMTHKVYDRDSHSNALCIRARLAAVDLELAWQQSI